MDKDRNSLLKFPITETTDLPLVMLVDDSDIDTFLNKKFLSIAGITDNTISFLSAQEALDYISINADNPEKLPPFILLDVQMPEINGFQFLDLYDSVPEKAQDKTRIVMLSSTIDPIDLDRARNNKHVIDILKKPLDTGALIEVLNQN